MLKLLAGSILYLAATIGLADELLDYEGIRCVPELNFFEYSRIPIYNANGGGTKGLQRSGSSRSRCSLGNVSISVEPTVITIREGAVTVFQGPKILEIIRVNGEGTIELCHVPSEIYGQVRSMQGGCIFRGFPALKSDGPRTPGEAIDIIRSKARSK
jgi:hypothetical protein